MDPADFLFLFDPSEVSHEPGYHLGDRLIDHTVVDIKLESDLEVSDARLMLKGVLEEVVDLATTEPGEPRQLMNNDDIDFSIGNRFAKPAILCATFFVSPRNNIGEPFDTRVGILLSDKFLELADLSLVVLAIG
ncbi:hypothetical protein C467_08800 [Halorubrum hochstenium ATCC 700873]|uniref:Uncharacterized protein n=1 Tax=Halorubrum hochstenium ATCC 700873 TaxID=1227481 RepID=M0F8I3_9EURY|nr:hypothetical protein C467_08800 [Halorubrum hochstenium ATCC 700873]